MNKLKLYEAMNLIDDDIVKEAEMPSDTVSEAVTDIEAEVTVSGVEQYRRPVWHKLAAIASAVVIIAGAAAGGAYYIKNRGTVAPDNEIVESEALAPTTGDGKESASSTVASDKGEKSPSTTTAAEENAESLVNTSGPPVKGEKMQNTTAQAASGGRTTTAKTNANGRNTTTAKTTTSAKTQQSPATTTAPLPIPPADGRLTLDLVKRYAEYGDNLTLGDFAPYDHEDIGSGVCVWEIPVYTENKDGKLEFEFTLIVNGMTGAKTDKCGVAELYYGKFTSPTKQDYIDIRYENVTDFVLKCRQKAGDPNTLTNVLGDIKDCHPDFIRSVELTHPMYNYFVALGHDEIKELLPMIQKLNFTKSVGNEWRNLDGNFTHIYVTDNKGIIHEYTLAGNKYFAVEGTGYEASYNDLLAIDTYTLSLLTKAEPAAPVDVDGVWCWHDASVESFDTRSFENITIKQYPDYVFSWNGMKHSIEIYNKKTRDKFGSVATQGQAYFADINGDGYPELCTTYDWGLNSRIVGELAVWDIHNGMIFRMNDPENEMIYWLYEEDGELRVNRQPAISSWSPDSKHGEQGRLEIGNYEVKFIPV
ncbi:MAG: hypothetical protein Q4A05_03750 [Ruminococcus sp.]|nr:hypothetical protein [Ruminococcus sp.]